MSDDVAGDGRGIVPPDILANLDHLDDDGLCRCDMIDEAHPPGTISADGHYCERLYTGPTVSPHLFDVGPDGEPR